MIDDVVILSDTMYGKMENGVQVGQAPIPDGLKSLPDSKLRLALRDIENLPEVLTAAPLPPTEKPVPVPYHEHEQGPVQPHEHDLIPHIHHLREEDEERVKAIELGSKIRDADLLKITGELRGDILRHEHPGYAAVGHIHTDVAAALESLQRQLLTESKHVHDEAPAHRHPETALLDDGFADLKATVITLGKMVEGLTNRLIELENKPPVNLAHTHSEFATAEALDAHLREMNNKAVYYTAELSNEDTGGKKRFIVQEASK